MEAEVEIPENTRYTIVVKRLSTFCKSKLFKDQINNVVRNASKMAFDGYNLLNLDILRRIEQDKELPNYNQTYLNRVVTAVTKGESTKDSFLNTTFKDHFKPCISESYNLPYNKNASLTRSEISRQMLVAVKNHTILNFQSRIRRYISLMYKIPFKLTRQFIYDTYTTDKMVKDEWKDASMELRNMFPLAPYPNVIKNNFSQFVRYSHRILSFIEHLPKNTKGARSFSLFPTKQDYVDTHIFLTNSTLQECLQQILSQTQEKILEHKKVSKSTFDENKEAFWYGLFNIKELETGNKKFDYKISTNGYKVSVYFRVPISSDFEHSFPTYDRIVGIDPGVSTLFTGYVDNGSFISSSHKEYKHLSNMNKQKTWTKKLRKRYPEYTSTCQDMPTFKTSLVDRFKEALKVAYAEFERLMNFNHKHSHLKWRFKTKVMSEKTLSKLVRRITENRKTYVGIGDWSQADIGVLRGHEPVPIKKLKEKLKKSNRVTLKEYDEYGTSKTCSCCGAIVENIKYHKECKDGVSRLVKVHEVVRCTNNECSKSWNRDKNSGRNHLLLCKCNLMGVNRPPAMIRGTDYKQYMEKNPNGDQFFMRCKSVQEERQK